MAPCHDCKPVAAELARVLEQNADLREEVGELQALLAEWHRIVASLLEARRQPRRAAAGGRR